jgi:hypothetical protein
MVVEGNVYLKFTCSQNEPDFLKIFIEGGGEVNAAATPWNTDFSMTGSTESTVVDLYRHHLKEVTIEIPRECWRCDTIDTISLPADMRINTCTNRIGASINGTLVLTVAGEGSEYMARILKSSGHSQIGLVYSSWLAHAASIGISGTRIVRIMPGGLEKVQNVMFEKRSPGDTQMLSDAAIAVNAYVQSAWATRQNIVYEPCPMLTKTVFKEVVGCDAQGYSLVHDIVERGSPVSLHTLDSLFAAGLRTDCCHDKNNYDAFMSATSVPGIMAAKEARTVASAASLVVNYLVAYRADGRNLVSATGADFAPAESWRRAQLRTPYDSEDCDGSALLGVGLIRAALNMTEEEELSHKHLKAVKNAISLYYQIGISIVGASASEATSADGEHTTVAGHAIAILMPSISILRGLDKANRKKIGNTDTCLCDTDEHAIEVSNARFDAMFPAEVRKNLSNDAEKENLKDWETAKESYIDVFEPYAIEGTTPSSPVMYMKDSQNRRDAETAAHNDDIALSKASPNVFRSIKSLHVGGSKSGSTHRFYRDLVEVTFPRTFPLYKNARLRKLQCAATQYVMARNQSSDSIQYAGATPKDLVEENYMLAPLVSLDEHTAVLLDHASEVAAKDVIPHRPHGPTVLNELQTKSLKQSMASLSKLGTDLNKSEPGVEDMHCVAYIAAFSTLVHNSKAVETFCNKIQKLAVCGYVDCVSIEGMAQGSDGSPAGEFVSINAYIPI